MLFFVNKAEQGFLAKVNLIAGEGEKLLLLVGDAVCFAQDGWTDTLAELRIEELFASKQDVEARKITVSADCDLLDDPQIVDLLFSGETVVSL